MQRKAFQTEKALQHKGVVAVHHGVEFFLGLPAERTAEGLIERLQRHKGLHAVAGSQRLPEILKGRLKEIFPFPILGLQGRLQFLAPFTQAGNGLAADFLDTLPNAKIVEKDDTASSARWIAEQHLKGHAAICGKLAAEIYGMEVLAEGIETNKRNFTRFVAIADRWTADEVMRDCVKNKASLVFAVPHVAGSLSRVLSVLSFYDMNLSKIQSLPIIGREWEYLFYVNLTFNDYIKYRQALDAIRPLTKDLKILGEYEEGRQGL